MHCVALEDVQQREQDAERRAAILGLDEDVRRRQRAPATRATNARVGARRPRRSVCAARGSRHAAARGARAKGRCVASRTASAPPCRSRPWSSDGARLPSPAASRISPVSAARLGSARQPQSVQARGHAPISRRIPQAFAARSFFRARRHRGSSVTVASGRRSVRAGPDTALTLRARFLWAPACAGDEFRRTLACPYTMFVDVRMQTVALRSALTRRRVHGIAAALVGLSLSIRSDAARRRAVVEGPARANENLVCADAQASDARSGQHRGRGPSTARRQPAARRPIVQAPLPRRRRSATAVGSAAERGLPA